MKAVIQRVTHCSVTVEDKVVAKIKNGILILLGITDTDTTEDIVWLTNKIANLRIFSDTEEKMNLSLLDVNGEALVVSQFTLQANTKKGNRPSYIRAAKPQQAIPLYTKFVETLEQILKKPVQTGKFGANMQVSLQNNGPVTIIIDTKNKE